MIIGLHDADGTNFPNLALMKLSAWHKANGDDIEFFDPEKQYDFVYSSKVFTWTPEDTSLPADTTIKCGTGYRSKETLPDVIEHICPDYDLYGLDRSYGFLTRGCSRKCGHCFVPGKEGDIKPHSDITEFARHHDVVLMDNNVLAHEHGIHQIEKIISLGLRVDFNQGLDARLIDDGIAQLLSRVKWLEPLRLACDSASQIPAIYNAVSLLRWHNTTPRRYFCYVLVKDIPDAIERIKLMKTLDLDPFAQPYRDEDGTEPTKEQSRFARWVNFKSAYKSVTWDEYLQDRTERGRI